MIYARKPRSPANFLLAWGRGLKLRLPLVAALLLAGCGGEPEDPTAQVREAVSALAAEAREGAWGDYCAGTTDPDACGTEIASAQALGIDLSALVPSEQVLDGAKIKVDGSRAVVDATAAEDAEYVLRDGRWLYVWQTESE